MIAVESPDPVIQQLELAEYVDIDDDNTATTQLTNSGLPGDFCEIYVYIQNKGRTHVTIIRLCVEVLVSTALPPTPIYEHIQADWNFKIGKDETSRVRADHISNIQLIKE
jgi:hypothetical protein